MTGEGQFLCNAMLVFFGSGSCEFLKAVRVPIFRPELYCQFTTFGSASFTQSRHSYHLPTIGFFANATPYTRR